MSWQQTAITMLCGALLATAAFGLYWAAKKAAETARDLIVGLKGIGKIAEANEKLVQTSAAVAIELQLLRSAIGAQTVPEGGEEPPAEGQRKPKPPNPFPAPDMNLYADVPDAKVEDTTIDDTDDATMIKYEELEAIRQSGREADPAELEEA